MNGDDRFLGGRVDRFKGLAVNAFDEFIVDEAGPGRREEESASVGLQASTPGMDLGGKRGSQTGQEKVETHSPVGCSYLP